MDYGLIELFCRELASRGLGYVAPLEMERLLRRLGMSLTANQTMAVADHLGRHRRLGDMVANNNG